MMRNDPAFTATAGGPVDITLPQLTAGAQDTPPVLMVHRLQGLLTALGSPVAIDGIFGPNTEAAVKQQQGACGLLESGVVDDNTWMVLIGGTVIPATATSTATATGTATATYTPPPPKWG